MVDRVERIGIHVDGANKAERDIHGIADAFGDLSKRVGGASAAMGGIAKVAGAASLAGPGLSGLLAVGKGLAAAGKGLAGLTPLLATLPSLAAASAAFVGTWKMAGPSIGKALSPIGAAFAGISGQVGKLASEGLPRMAREFVKVNFPIIGQSMKEIAKDTNTVLRTIGRWANGAEGRSAIIQIMEATTAASERLDGVISRLALSFLDMIGRVGGDAIGAAATGIEKLANATAKWMDSITKDDVNEALDDLSGWFIKVRDVFGMLRDVGRWMSDNEDKVRKFSDVVAGMAIVLGAATGNWVAVLAGTASITANHWDGLKKTFSSGGAFFSDIWKKISNDPNVRGLADSLRKNWQGFVDSFKKNTSELGPKFREYVDQLKKTWDEWGPILKAWWDGVGKPVLSAFGTALGKIITIALDIGIFVGKGLDKAGEAFKQLWVVVSIVLSNIINAAATAFGWVPGLGDKLKKAADDFNKFRDRVNAALDGIEDEEVKLNVKVTGAGADALGGKASSGQVRFLAAGGPARAGEPVIVGEEGPELFVPNSSGYVHPNRAGGSTAGGVGVHFSGDLSSAFASAFMAMVRTGRITLTVAGNRVVVS